LKSGRGVPPEKNSRRAERELDFLGDTTLMINKDKTRDHFSWSKERIGGRGKGKKYSSLHSFGEKRKKRSERAGEPLRGEWLRTTKKDISSSTGKAPGYLEPSASLGKVQELSNTWLGEKRKRTSSLRFHEELRLRRGGTKVSTEKGG